MTFKHPCLLFVGLLALWPVEKVELTVVVVLVISDQTFTKSVAEVCTGRSQSVFW